MVASLHGGYSTTHYKHGIVRPMLLIYSIVDCLCSIFHFVARPQISQVLVSVALSSDIVSNQPVRRPAAANNSFARSLLSLECSDRGLIAFSTNSSTLDLCWRDMTLLEQLSIRYQRASMPSWGSSPRYNGPLKWVPSICTKVRIHCDSARLWDRSWALYPAYASSSIGEVDKRWSSSVGGRKMNYQKIPMIRRIGRRYVPRNNQ
jgi:hypothetical protein